MERERERERARVNVSRFHRRFSFVFFSSSFLRPHLSLSPYLIRFHLTLVDDDDVIAQCARPPFLVTRKIIVLLFRLLAMVSRFRVFSSQLSCAALRNGPSAVARLPEHLRCDSFNFFPVAPTKNALFSIISISSECLLQSSISPRISPRLSHIVSIIFYHLDGEAGSLSMRCHILPYNCIHMRPIPILLPVFHSKLYNSQQQSLRSHLQIS